MTTRKPPVAVPVMRIPRWRAFDSTGEAHAFLTRQGDAACGFKNPGDERHDWPRRVRHEGCVKALEAL